MWRLLGLLLGASLWAGPAAAQGLLCQDVSFETVTHTVCEIDLAQVDLRLFHSDQEGQLYGQFGRLERSFDLPLIFGMNGGMYHEDRAPVGLYIEDGVERSPLVTRAGPGNFGMLPNGVFCFGEGKAEVVESRAFAAAPRACRFATQSGPMLVIDGALHPRFLADSTSRNIRNGVGVKDGKAIFAISRSPVTFHHFGRLFKDVIGVDQALYLDGRISRLWAPSIGRRDGGLRMGPVIGAFGR